MSGRMEKQNVACPHDGVLLSHEEMKYTPHYNMHEPWKLSSVKETSHKYHTLCGACTWNVQNGDIADGNSVSGRRELEAGVD